MSKTKAFDNFASEYDSWYDHHPVEYQQELEAIKMLLPAEGEGLEIGAGTGRFAGPLGIAAGVEPSPAMREIATQRGISVIEGVAESLPFKDCTYDYVLYVTTVCFVDSPIKAFIEAYRVLKPAGHIVIGMIDRNSKLGRQYEARKQGESRFFKDATFYAVSEVQAYLQQTGFIDIECAQAILPADVNGHTVPEVKRGYGEGSFVVLRAHKSS